MYTCTRKKRQLTFDKFGWFFSVSGHFGPEKTGRSGLSISSKIDHFGPFSLVNSAKLKNSRFDRNINRHNWKLLGLHREVLQCPKPLLHLSDGNKYQSMANLNVQICYYISHNLITSWERTSTTGNCLMHRSRIQKDDDFKIHFVYLYKSFNYP